MGGERRSLRIRGGDRGGGEYIVSDDRRRGDEENHLTFTPHRRPMTRETNSRWTGRWLRTGGIIPDAQQDAHTSACHGSLRGVWRRYRCPRLSMSGTLPRRPIILLRFIVLCLALACAVAIGRVFSLLFSRALSGIRIWLFGTLPDSRLGYPLSPTHPGSGLSVDSPPPLRLHPASYSDPSFDSSSHPTSEAVPISSDRGPHSQSESGSGMDPEVFRYIDSVTQNLEVDPYALTRVSPRRLPLSRGRRGTVCLSGHPQRGRPHTVPARASR